MAYLAGLLDRKKTGQPLILKMLGAPNPRQSKGVWLASPQGLMGGGEALETHSTPIVGINPVTPETFPHQIFSQGEAAVCFNGLVFAEEPEALAFSDALDPGSPTLGLEKMYSLDGAYTFIAATEEALLAGVDPIGTIPLYYGENRDLAAAATTKRMLWSIGLTANPVPRGHILRLTRQRTTPTKVREIKPGQPQKVDPKQLDTVLRNAFQDYAAKTPRASLAFSGGIDSLLTAHYLDALGVQLRLIWVGMEDAEEQYHAREAADHLGLEIYARTFSPQQLHQDLAKVLQSIEEPNPLKIGFSTPFHWASQTASQLGDPWLYTGSGADELFGGYWKYLEKQLKGGAPREDMIKDIAEAPERSYHPIFKTCLAQGVFPLSPFTHPRVVELGLRTPIEQKISGNVGDPRKRILRELAIELGLPPELAHRKKKAAQYSTNIQRELTKIAKKQGKTLTELLKEMFRAR